jgi:hypothetical protein
MHPRLTGVAGAGRTGAALLAGRGLFRLRDRYRERRVPDRPTLRRSDGRESNRQPLPP